MKGRAKTKENIVLWNMRFVSLSEMVCYDYRLRDFNITTLVVCAI